MADYQAGIREFIVENFLFGDGKHLHDNDSLMDTGIIDSTGVLELIFFLEKTYQVTIAPSELTPENMDSIDNIARFIESKGPTREALAAAPAAAAPQQPGA